jgi:hypothetical protein
LAYIDPGNGAYMVQVLFTVFAAALFYLRHPIRLVQALWRWFLSGSRKPRVSKPVDSPIPTEHERYGSRNCKPASDEAPEQR